MKKKISALLAVTMALTLTACGGGAASGASSAAAPADTGAASAASAASEASAAAPSGSAVNLRFATGGTSGTYYAYGGVLTNIVNDKAQGVNLTVQSTGASKANIFLLDDKEADIALVQNDVMDYGYNGTDLFQEDGAVTTYSAVAALYSEVCHVVSSEGVTSIEELKGKNVSVGDAGSGTEFNARQILEAYGLSFDDIKVTNLGFGDSAEALKDGKIDAFFCVAGAPTTAITELATTNKISILNVDGDHAKGLIEKYPFYDNFTIPANTYKGVEADVNTVAIKATIIASNDVSEDAVYEMVKTIFDNKDEIKEAHAKGAELDPAYAVKGISIPFHPGAEKYFKEAGALK